MKLVEIQLLSPKHSDLLKVVNMIKLAGKRMNHGLIFCKYLLQPSSRMIRVTSD